MSEPQQKRARTSEPIEIVEYYEDGTTIRVRYMMKGLLREGKYIEFYQNGKKSVIANYVNGLLNGRYVRFDDAGRHILVCHYEDGVYHGCSTAYHNNGAVSERRHYYKGLIDGTLIRWSHDGVRTCKCKYVKGRLDGPYIEYSNGIADTITEYEDGVKMGRSEKLNRDGYYA